MGIWLKDPLHSVSFFICNDLQFNTLYSGLLNYEVQSTHIGTVCTAERLSTFPFLKLTFLNVKMWGTPFFFKTYTDNNKYIDLMIGN